LFSLRRVLSTSVRVGDVALAAFLVLEEERRELETAGKLLSRERRSFFSERYCMSSSRVDEFLCMSILSTHASVTFLDLKGPGGEIGGQDRFKLQG
jgi:hypothetical protein